MEDILFPRLYPSTVGSSHMLFYIKHLTLQISIQGDPYLPRNLNIIIYISL